MRWLSVAGPGRRTGGEEFTLETLVSFAHPIDMGMHGLQLAAIEGQQSLGGSLDGPGLDPMSISFHSPLPSPLDKTHFPPTGLQNWVYIDEMVAEAKH